MKSVKPGRGPSMMGGFVGIFMVIFGIAWTVIASQAGGLFVLFGIGWTCIALGNTIYQFKNATGKNRYSEFDITDDGEEDDPLNARFGTRREAHSDRPSRFCPYCGTPADRDFSFCRNCGKNLP